MAGGAAASRGSELARARSGRRSVATYAVRILIVFLADLFGAVHLDLVVGVEDVDEIARDPFGLPDSFAGRTWTKPGRSATSTATCGTVSSTAWRSSPGWSRSPALAGYALALLPLPGRDGILMLFLLGLMVPFQSVMIPLYYLLRDLHLLETYWAFIVPGIALRLPFGIFLMRGFFRGLPPELADAARIDGANEWHVFRQVMLPLAMPGLATLVVFQFMWTWNQFLMPLIFVQRDELRPVSLGTMFFFGRFTADRGMIAAGVTISMLPVVILYLFLQRRFIEGITAGALKS